MGAPAIFVSHSHKDDEYCHALVAGLRAAGLDVWYDEHNATAGHLRTLIERELRLRPVFVVVLTPAALASDWVSDECDWAYNLYRRDKERRVILPVLAQTVNEDDIWLFMQQFKRIEQAGMIPWPAAEAARRVALAIDPNAPLAAPPPNQQASQAARQADEVATLLARANALASQGKRRDAIAVLRRATTLAPRSVAAWNALGFNLDYLHNTSEALEAFERTLLLDPNNAFAWAGRANTLAVDHPQRALLYAEKALALDATNVLALNGKGLALDTLGRYQEALDTFDQAIALDPTDAHVWSNRGASLNKLTRHQEALDSYNRALAIEPNSFKWTGKAYALSMLGRQNEALDALERATMLDPNNDFAWHSKGNALTSLGRHQEALAAFERAISLEPNAIRWAGKGFALTNLGRYQEALDACERALALDPSNSYAWNGKGFALHELGRYQEALAAYERALAIEQNANRWYGKANALRKLGRTVDADAAERKGKELAAKK